MLSYRTADVQGRGMTVRRRLSFATRLAAPDRESRPGTANIANIRAQTCWEQVEHGCRGAQ